jgi:acetolactate synthase-1/2/3 large subunit
MTGAEIFVEASSPKRSRCSSAIREGATIGVYDALHDISDIKHVLTRHEQGATHAAEGYAKATGKPGVVLVTSGPGATNTVTGIADAYDGFDPPCRFYGTGFPSSYRQRRVPGGGHRRHHASGHEAQLPRP